MKPGLRYALAALTVSAAGLAGIRHDEGEVRQVYLDPVNIPTVCVGHTSTVTEKDVGELYSEHQCSVLLKQDLRDAESAVQRLVKIKLTQAQYDALVSWVFNLGAGNLASSTMLVRINAGDCWAAGKEMRRWNRAGARVLPGLTIRRNREARLWESGCESKSSSSSA